jgi:UDP-N-acetylmuramate--alanine ligase
MYRKDQHIHFIGIGGIGMSGIAEVLVNLGYRISGSDIKESGITRRLAAMGVKIFYRHDPENIEGAQVVVVSSAVRPDNPEVAAARQRQIPVIPRAEMLAELMRMKYGIAIAGTHGKTSTTSMVATMLSTGGLDPTMVIGGRLDIIESNAKLGQGDFLVAEADESDGTILQLIPTIAVLTNIDHEHLDYYKDIEEIKDTLAEFMNKVPFYGVAIVNLDEIYIQEIIPRISKRMITYGMTAQSEVLATDIKFRGLSSSYDLHYRGEFLSRIELNVPGRHSVSNSLAAAAVGLELELGLDKIKEGLQSFKGAMRRFEVKAEINDIMVVDDYAHHPTEIRASLTAAREGFGRRILAVFQPHRFTRTKFLAKELATAFYDADHLVITRIYPAGEDPIPGVTAETIYEAAKEYGHKDVVFIDKLEDIPRHLAEIVQPQDLVITLGAGNVNTVADKFIELLENSFEDR